MCVMWLKCWYLIGRGKHYKRPASGKNAEFANAEKCQTHVNHRIWGGQVHPHSFLILALHLDEWPPSTPNGKDHCCSLNTRLDGANSQPQCCGEEKTLTLLGIEGVLGYPVHSLVTTPTTLIWYFIPSSICTNHELHNMAAHQPGHSAFYWCSVVAEMEVHVKSYAEACVDQNHSSCCFLVPLLLADRLLVVGLEWDNVVLTGCLPAPQCSSGLLCFAEKPANSDSKFKVDNLRTHYDKTSRHINIGQGKGKAAPVHAMKAIHLPASCLRWRYRSTYWVQGCLDPKVSLDTYIGGIIPHMDRINSE